MFDPSFAQAVAFGRDVSLVFLSLLCLVAWAVPLVALFFAQKYMRLGRHKLQMPMLYAQLWALRVENATLSAAHKVARVPIALNAGAARLKGTFQGIAKRFT